MPRALVTGATGFVGANLARRLVREGHAVHLLVRPDHAPWRIADLHGHVQLHEAALEDGPAVRRAVAAVRPEWVFHLAAYGAYSWQTDVQRMIDVNVRGTATLLDCCLATSAVFVNAGSSSEYGFKDHAPSEDAALDPNSPYAVTKAAATHLCRHGARTRGVRVPTLRLYSIYGPYEEPGRLMPALALNGLAGRLPPLVDPAIARDFVHVDDAVEAFVRAAALPGAAPDAVYNVGSGVQTTLGELVELARSVFGITEPPRWGSLAPRSWDTSIWRADAGRIADALDWRPERTLEQGLRGLAAWIDAEPERRAFYERHAASRER